MAKKIISHGEHIDKLRAEIVEALALCKKQEQALTKKGVQIGKIHFKTERQNCMYILEPTTAGRRPYVHVGVDPKKQADAMARVDRWEQRNNLRKAMTRLEDELRNMDYQIQHVVHIVSSVHEHATMIVDQHVETKR